MSNFKCQIINILKFLFTNNQIIPAASPDDLLHSVLVGCGEAKPEEEDGDVVQLVAEVQVDSFRKISINNSKQIKRAYWSRFCNFRD